MHFRIGDEVFNKKDLEADKATALKVSFVEEGFMQAEDKVTKHVFSGSEKDFIHTDPLCRVCCCPSL